MRRIALCALLAAACGRGEDGDGSSQRSALAAAPLGGLVAGQLPGCSDVDLAQLEEGGEAAIEELAGGRLIVEIDGVALCQGTEEEIARALAHVVLDPSAGTPLPSYTRDGEPPPPDGTPLPSAY